MHRSTAVAAFCALTWMGCQAAPSEEETIIRSTYDRMTTYTQAGGATVTFELKDFSTYHPKSFTKSRMIDVASMPEGRVIDVTRHEQQVAGVGSYAQYLASWHDQGRNSSAETLCDSPDPAVMNHGGAHGKDLGKGRKGDLQHIFTILSRGTHFRSVD